MSLLNKRVVYLLEHCVLTGILLVLGSIISLQVQARPNDPEVPAIERPVHITCLLYTSPSPRDRG